MHGACDHPHTHLVWEVVSVARRIAVSDCRRWTNSSSVELTAGETQTNERGE
jgi:hypothetical protein